MSTVTTTAIVRYMSDEELTKILILKIFDFTHEQISQLYHMGIYEFHMFRQCAVQKAYRVYMRKRILFDTFFHISYDIDYDRLLLCSKLEYAFLSGYSASGMISVISMYTQSLNESIQNADPYSISFDQLTHFAEFWIADAEEDYPPVHYSDIHNAQFLKDLNSNDLSNYNTDFGICYI